MFYLNSSSARTLEATGELSSPLTSFSCEGGGAMVGMYCCRGMVPTMMGIFTTRSRAGPAGSTWNWRLYWTVLYCNVLYCTVLYRTVLYYTVLYCTRTN